MHKLTIGTLFLSIGLFLFAGCSGDESTSVKPENSSDLKVAENPSEVGAAEEAGGNQPVADAKADDPALSDTDVDQTDEGTGFSIDTPEIPAVDGDPAADNNVFGSNEDLTIDEPSDGKIEGDPAFDDIFGGAEDEPVVDQQPAADEAPAVEEQPAADESAPVEEQPAADDIFGAAADSTDEAPFAEPVEEEAGADEPVFGEADQADNEPAATDSIFDEPAAEEEADVVEPFGDEQPVADEAPPVEEQPAADDIFGAADDSTDEAPFAEPGEEEAGADEPVLGEADQADHEPAATDSIFDEPAAEDSILDESAVEDESTLDEPVDDQPPAADEAAAADDEPGIDAESADVEPFADPAVDQPTVAKPEMRTWTDSSGLYTREAVFVAFNDGTVFLTNKVGNPVRIPVERLSKADQQYVHDMVAALEEEQPDESGAAALQE